MDDNGCRPSGLDLHSPPGERQPATDPELRPDGGTVGDDVRGWILLSDDDAGARATIEGAATNTDVNQIQLSHKIIMDLREIRKPDTQSQVADLTEHARDHGIEDVTVWDHCLYDIEYYPDEFKTADGQLDFDDPDFWNWFRADYREMLDLAPDLDAVNLTFIETGAKIRYQHSANLDAAGRIATAVNAIAEVLQEYDMDLYARTFAYDEEEYEILSNAVEAFEFDNIGLMMKESPHDFFLPHPQNPLAGAFDRETIVEFDTAGEFHGQGVVQNTFPEQFLERAGGVSQEGKPGLLQRENVVGYCARMDRWGDTHIVNTPAEINAYALEAFADDPDTTAADVYDEFVAERYGDGAVEPLGEAFRNGLDIALATFYTLNTNTADHSRLNYDPYPSSYARHVSGRWLETPRTYVPRGVDREFHYWKDLVYHLAPTWAKQGGAQLGELTDQQIEWVGMEEQMNEEYLRYVLTEKDDAIDLAEANLEHLADARPHLDDEQYADFGRYFTDTLRCLRLRRETAAAYWGFRVWARGEAHRSRYVVDTVEAALDDVLDLADEIAQTTPKPRAGQWDFTVDDPEMARQYHAWITEEGWPEEIRGAPVSFGGVTFDPDR